MNRRLLRLLVFAPVVAWCSMAVPSPTEQGTRTGRLPLPPTGTRFYFDVIQSHDERYAGDTPSHLGRDGGLTSRPNVALGDPVHRRDGEKDTLVGHVTSVSWDRVSGSLTVEFDPVEKVRVAVGDEVWIDLNPQIP